MCHSSHGPPTLPVTNENTTSTASAQWKRRSGASQTATRGFATVARLLRAIVVVAGLACRAGVAHRLLERREVATRRLRQLLRFPDHLLHLRVEVGALLPDLRL